MTEAVKRVLIVDDDDGIRRSLARIMRCKGFEVETAGDGESAVLVSCQFDPHLLLLDIRMPGIDGIETFERIRSERPHVSAIFMTAYSSSVRVDKAISLGAISVMSKPLDIESLSHLVEETLADVPVLLVDEDETALNFLRSKLKAKGVEVATTGCLAEATESLRCRPRQVVLVFGQPNESAAAVDQAKELPTGLQWIPKPVDVDALVTQIELTKAALH